MIWFWRHCVKPGRGQLKKHIRVWHFNFIIKPSVQISNWAGWSNWRSIVESNILDKSRSDESNALERTVHTTRCRQGLFLIFNEYNLDFAILGPNKLGIEATEETCYNVTPSWPKSDGLQQVTHYREKQTLITQPSVETTVCGGSSWRNTLESKDNTLERNKHCKH